MWNFNLKSSVLWIFKSKLQCKTSIRKVQCIELSNQNFSVKLQCIELSHQNFSVHWTFTSKLQCKTSMHWTFKLKLKCIELLTLKFWYESSMHWTFQIEVFRTKLSHLFFCKDSEWLSGLSSHSYHSVWVAAPATLADGWAAECFSGWWIASAA